MSLHELSRYAKHVPTKHALTKPKETKQQRAKRLKKQRAAKQELRQRLVEDPDAILTFKEWCSLCGHSERQGRIIIASGNGPPVTWLSARRMGISRRHHREWLEKRAR